MPQIKEVLNYIGNKVSEATQKILQLMNDSGIITSSTTSKFVSILLILGLSWLVVHFFAGLKKPIKVGIIIVSSLLIISIISTFI